MIKIYKYGEVAKDEIFARVTPAFDVAGIVADIIQNVKTNGDNALLDYTERFDGVRLSALAVTSEEIDEAFAEVEPKFIEILENEKEITDTAIGRMYGMCIECMRRRKERTDRRSGK